MFADDSLLFIRANISKEKKVLDILALYQNAYGHLVNLDKSEAFFSWNVPIEDKNMIYEMMGVKTLEA